MEIEMSEDEEENEDMEVERSEEEGTDSMDSNNPDFILDDRELEMKKRGFIASTLVDNY